MLPLPLMLLHAEPRIDGYSHRCKARVHGLFDIHFGLNAWLQAMPKMHQYLAR